MTGKLIIFSAPSGSGKSTIINYLMQQGLGLEHALPVLGAGSVLLAPALAAVHVIVETGPVLAHIPGKYLAAAG